MGVDLYSGPLIRHQTRNWKTSTQVASEQLGIEYRLDIAKPPPDPASAEASILAWRAALEEELGVALDWPESNVGPYRTVQTGWEEWRALRLFATWQQFPDRSLPARIDYHADERWEPLQRRCDAVYDGRRTAFDRLLRRHRALPAGAYANLVLPILWLPIDFSGLHAPVSVTFGPGDAPLGSVPGLRRDLEALNDRTFRGDDAALGEWSGDDPETPEVERILKRTLATWLLFVRDAEADGFPVLVDF